MTGHQYEYLYALYLKCMGYPQVIVTRGSGDQGVDIVAYKGYQKFAFQCKLQSTPVSNGAVQGVFAGAKHYECNRAIVVTNNTFTKSAKELAQTNNVTLVPEKNIEYLVKICADGYKEGKFNSENNLLGHLPADIQDAIISGDKGAINNIDTGIDRSKSGTAHNKNDIAEKTQIILMSQHNNTNVKVCDPISLNSYMKNANPDVMAGRTNGTHVVDRTNNIVNNDYPPYNVNVQQPTYKPQKKYTSISPILIYVIGLIIKIFFDVMCIITLYACIFAILITFLCVNPKWYKSRAYRISNIVIGILLMCIGGLVLLMGMPAFKELPNTFIYIKSGTYTNMFQLQALYYGCALSVSALLFLCVKFKEVPI